MWIEKYLKPKFINCNECGRGAKLTWHNLTDYTIEPVDIEPTTDVFYTTKGLNINIDVVSDKWLIVWVGLRQVFLCDKCQAKRREWAIKTFGINPPTKQSPKKEKQQKVVTPQTNDDYLDFPLI